MKYQVIFLLICGIRSSYQIYDIHNNTCFDTITGRRDVCCYNYEWTDGMCKECKIGTTTNAGGQCMSCTNNTFGYKCIEKCVCNQSQRCDTEVGCILKTSNSTMHTTYTALNNISAGPTEQALLPNENVTANEIVPANKTTVIRNGTSISEWIILILCITGCFILTGFSYLIQIYRKRLSFKLRSTNEGVILEPIEPSSYIGVYDEVDENPLTFDMTDLKVTSQESHFETIDCDSYERLSIIASTEHGDTGYLDPYFAMEEDENHQLQDRTSQTECSSTNSSNSDVVDQDNIAYNNLYQPLQEDWQDDSHGYEVPVMVHKCFENSAGFDEHATSHSYYNVYKPLQKDWDIKSPTYENQKFQETKAGNDKRLLADDFSSELKTGNLHEYINMVAESNISIEICDNCHAMESCKTFDQDKSKTIEQKSC